MEARKEYNGIKLTFGDGYTERDAFLDWVGWIVRINGEKDVRLKGADVGVLTVQDWDDDAEDESGEPYKIQVDQIHTIHVY